MPPREIPLDVENYPVAPAELVLEQVHVFVRHGEFNLSYWVQDIWANRLSFVGERTPVGVRLTGPPASIPEFWLSL